MSSVAWRGEGHEAHLTLTAEEDRAVREAHQRAADRRRALDRALERVRNETAEHNSKLEGLDFSLKSLNSFRSKVARRPRRRSAKDVADSTNDLNRYTLTFPREQYTDGVRDAYRRLEDQKFVMLKERNTLNEPDYRGINSTWAVVEDGEVLQQFEVQFHTPEWFRVKDRDNHLLYELDRARATVDTRRMSEAERYDHLQYREAVRHIQTERYGDTEPPPGHEELITPVEHRPLAEVEQRYVDQVLADEDELRERKAQEAREKAEREAQGGTEREGEPRGRLAGEPEDGLDEGGAEGDGVPEEAPVERGEEVVLEESGDVEDDVLVESGVGEQEESEVEADSQADVDAQVEDDTQAQTDVATEQQAESETDAQVESETEAQAQAQAEAEDEQQTQADEAQSEADAQVEAEAQAETDAEQQAQTDETEQQTQAETEAQAESEDEQQAQAGEVESEADAQVESKTEAQAETDAEQQAQAGEVEAEAGSEVGSEADAQVGSETEAQAEPNAEQQAQTDEVEPEADSQAQVESETDELAASEAEGQAGVEVEGEGRAGGQAEGDELAEAGVRGRPRPWVRRMTPRRGWTTAGRQARAGRWARAGR